jgi:hypothetical protein
VNPVLDAMLGAAKRGVARSLLQVALMLEVRIDDQAERWRVFKKVLGKMAKGEL